MNSTNQYINQLKQQSKIIEYNNQKEEILQDINNIINRVEHESGTVIHNRPSAITKLAKRMQQTHPKYSFNPVICQILNEIIQDQALSSPKTRVPNSSKFGGGLW